MDEINTQLENLKKIVSSQTEEINELKQSLVKLRRGFLLPPHLSVQESEFENCKLLLESDLWPAAVDPALICDVSSEQDKEDRAEGILDLVIDQPLENMRFLDFGCGEGYVVNRSKIQKPKITVGYDIEKSKKWKDWGEDSITKFTTDWDTVKEHAPYNVILLYDVIDHIKGPEESFATELQRQQNPGSHHNESYLVNEMCKIKSVLAPHGKIYVRCHPWCSRHGNHLYQKINKAYVHLVFTEEELKSMGYEGIWTRPIIHTTYIYNPIFNKAGLRILSEQAQTEPVEPFFKDVFVIAKRIKKNWPAWDNHRLGLTQQFIDYILGQ